MVIQLFSQQNCPTVTTQILGESCEGANDGIIDITVSEGIPPYTFQWSNGASSEDLTGLAPGGYSVIVIDSTGCFTQYPAYNVLEEPIFIPDAGNEPLAAPIEVNQYEASETITTGDEFEICVVMEHSWLRDLEISLQTFEEQIDLSNQPGGVYFIEMASSGSRLVEKLILSK